MKIFNGQTNFQRRQYYDENVTKFCPNRPTLNHSIFGVMSSGWYSKCVHANDYWSWNVNYIVYIRDIRLMMWNRRRIVFSSLVLLNKRFQAKDNLDKIANLFIASHGCNGGRFNGVKHFNFKSKWDVHLLNEQKTGFMLFIFNRASKLFVVLITFLSCLKDENARQSV